MALLHESILRWSAGIATAAHILCAAPIRAQGADAIDTYTRLVQKTVLRAPQIAAPQLTDAEIPNATSEAMAKLERLFSENGIAIVQDGPHFVRLLPKDAVNQVTALIPLRGQEIARTKDQPIIPKGMISMVNASLQQVLTLYADLRQRTILQPESLGYPQINFKSETALSKAEAAYALETTLELNGFCLVDDGQKFVQIVWLPERDIVKTNAPKAQPNAKMIDPHRVPSVPADRDPHARLSPAEVEFKKLENAFFDFIKYKPAPDVPVKHLLQLYAKVADKSAECPKALETRPIHFRLQTPVTKEELEYAIETTFRLNGLAIAPSGTALSLREIKPPKSVKRISPKT